MDAISVADSRPNHKRNANPTSPAPASITKSLFIPTPLVGVFLPRTTGLMRDGGGYIAPMKRSMGGDALRGPLGVMRQRRTLRLMQIVLVLIAGGIMMLAGYSYGKVDGYTAARRSDSFDAPRPPSIGQTMALVMLGGVPIAVALLLERGGLGVPTPARLDELTGRAEQAALERAERAAGQADSGI